MLRINKQNISFTRGENVSLNISIYDTDGQPFILPPLPNEDIPNDICTVLIFTVRAGSYDKIVLTKNMNILTSTIRISKTVEDFSANGFNKFITQDIDSVSEITDLDDYFGYTIPTLETPTDEQKANRRRVVKCEEDSLYYFWISPTIDPIDNNGQIGVYTFEFIFPILHDYTSNLEAKNYKYDLIAYIGLLKETYQEYEFPLSTVYWKKELISPHNFVLEDTNNV